MNPTLDICKINYHFIDSAWQRSFGGRLGDSGFNDAPPNGDEIASETGVSWLVGDDIMLDGCFPIEYACIGGYGAVSASFFFCNVGPSSLWMGLVRRLDVRLIRARLLLQ